MIRLPRVENRRSGLRPIELEPEWFSCTEIDPVQCHLLRKVRANLPNQFPGPPIRRVGIVGGGDTNNGMGTIKTRGPDWGLSNHRSKLGKDVPRHRSRGTILRDSSQWGRCHWCSRCRRERWTWLSNRWRSRPTRWKGCSLRTGSRDEKKPHKDHQTRRQTFWSHEKPSLSDITQAKS
jgi:hypothetical protein